MSFHYPRPSPARRIALGLVQAAGLGAGLMALTWFIAGHCLSVGGAALTYLLFLAAFAPMTLTTTWNGPRGSSRPMKLAMFGFFFLSLIALALAGPDTMCVTSPSAPLSAAMTAVAGLVLWAVLLMLGPKHKSATEPPIEPGESRNLTRGRS